MKHIYLDCEFVPNELTYKGLVSIAVTDGTDHVYAVNCDMDQNLVCQRSWMVENVWRHIPNKGRGILNLSHKDVKTYDEIREDISTFLQERCPSGEAKNDLRVVALCGAQDMVRLHGLWDHDWSVMPRWVPRHFDDLESIMIDKGVHEDGGYVVDSKGVLLPIQMPHRMHHALHDALHDYQVHRFLEGR